MDRSTKPELASSCCASREKANVQAHFIERAQEQNQIQPTPAKGTQTNRSGAAEPAKPKFTLGIAAARKSIEGCAVIEDENTTYLVPDNWTLKWTDSVTPR